MGLFGPGRRAIAGVLLRAAVAVEDRHANNPDEALLAGAFGREGLFGGPVQRSDVHRFPGRQRKEWRAAVDALVAWTAANGGTHRGGDRWRLSGVGRGQWGHADLAKALRACAADVRRGAR